MNTIYGWFYLIGVIILLPKVESFIRSKTNNNDFSSMLYGIGVLVIGFIINVSQHKQSAISYDKIENDTAIVAKAPQAVETNQRKDINTLFSPWDGSLPALVKYTKRNMNDPDSFEHVETRFENKGNNLFVAMEYRGKNKFGTKVIAYIYALVDKDGNIISIEN